MKSDSRYQRRARVRDYRPRAGSSVSESVVMRIGHRVHKLGGRHDGVDQSIRHADVTEWIGLKQPTNTNVRGVHAAQFSKTAASRRRDSPSFTHGPDRGLPQRDRGI